MKIFWLSFIFLVQESVINMRVQILHELIDDLNPYVIIIFTDNLKKINTKQNIFLRNLANQNPTVKIDLDNISQTNDNRSFELTVFINLRRSAICIILPSEKSETSRILDTIVNTSAVSSRCKTVLILPTNCSDRAEKKILIKAWNLKFLDFSIVKTDIYDNHTFETYPFTNVYYKKKISNDKNSIFPDKLKNVHGHPLKTQV